MATPWFCKIDGEEVGPVSGATLKEMVSDGSVERKTLIRRGDNSRWVTAGQVQGLFDQQTAKAAPASASSSNLKLKRAESLDVPPRPPLPPPVAGPPPPVEAGAVPAAAAPPISDSQAIPTGVPVGAPVGTTEQIPTGQIPMGQVPMGQIPTGQAVAPTGSAGGAYQEEGHENPYEARRQKKKMQQMLVIAGMVIVALAAAAGGITYAIVGGGGEQPEVATNDPVDEIDPLNPVAADPAATAEADADAEAIARQQAADEEAAAVKAMLAEVVSGRGRWYDISPGRIRFPKTYTLRVTDAWLSDSSTGATALNPSMILGSGNATALVAKPADETDTVDDDEAEEPEVNPLEAILQAQGQALPNAEVDEDANEPAASDSGRYVIVRVELTNDGEEPLTYESWNPLAGAEIAASLIANETSELKAISIKQAAGPGREGRVVLQSNDVLVDHLVFAAPDLPVSSLKLIMPKQAVGRKGVYGFDISSEALRTKYDQHLAMLEKEKAANAEVPAVAAPAPAVAAPDNAVAEAPPEAEPPKPLSEAEKLRRERDAFLRGINDDPEEKKPDENE